MVILAVALSAVCVNSLRVQGNAFVNHEGETIHIHGVNRMGTEYMCISGGGFFDGPNTSSSLAAMKKWGINGVRIPLNEDCWLGINGAPPKFSGPAYHSAVDSYVELLGREKMYAVVDLHWTASGGAKADKQAPMIDADHGLKVWMSIASKLRRHSHVLFDLFNEPYGIDWNCWKNGCDFQGFKTLGMQELVTHIRKIANNTLLLGGLAYSNDLSGWLQHVPSDPHHNLAASWHSYNFNSCNNRGCWDSQIAPVAAKYPVVTGEFGENDCAHGYVDQLLPWLDSHKISYLGWTWNTADCAKTPALISNYDGTPTNFGVGYKNHLAKHYL